MITVPEATRTIIKRSRYLSEAISKNLINFSSLARYIKPEIEEMLIKKVSTSSIIMALKRIEPEFQPHFKSPHIFLYPPSFVIHSSLRLITIKKPISNKLIANEKKEFMFYTEGKNEISVVSTNVHIESLIHILNTHEFVVHPQAVSSLTIQLPLEAQLTPGIFYFFLKSLAWEGINILALFSNPEEFTLILSDEDVQQAFSILKSLFS